MYSIVDNGDPIEILVAPDQVASEIVADLTIIGKSISSLSDQEIDEIVDQKTDEIADGYRENGFAEEEYRIIFVEYLRISQILKTYR